MMPRPKRPHFLPPKRVIEWMNIWDQLLMRYVIFCRLSPPSSEGVRLSAHQTAGPCGWLIIDSAGLLVTWREHKPPAADDIQISIRPRNRTLKFHIINFDLFSILFLVETTKQVPPGGLDGNFFKIFLKFQIRPAVDGIKRKWPYFAGRGEWCL